MLSNVLLTVCGGMRMTRPSGCVVWQVSGGSEERPPLIYSDLGPSFQRVPVAGARLSEIQAYCFIGTRLSVPMLTSWQHKLKKIPKWRPDETEKGK
jgi:hypothetical protein